MILTCPECATRYFVDDDRVGTSGRTVRCAACGANWRAALEAPLELTAGTEPAPMLRSAEPVSFGRNEPAAPEPSASAAPEVHRTFRAKVEQKRRVREAAAAGVVWGLMCVGFALLVGAAYLFRVDVVKLYPKAAGAYAWVGAPVNPTGLAFEKIAATPAPDGLAAVTVSGQVRNVIGHATSAPPIRVALLDKSGARIATQVLRLPTPSLAPGKTQAFSVSLPDPKAAAANVDVAFALDIKPAPQAKPRPVVVHAAAVPPTPNAPLFATQPPPAATAQAAPLRTTPAKTAPTTVVKSAPKSGPAGLRPPLGVSTQRAEEAKPLPANDPYALQPAPHG
ncbi:MAG TPA: DUF3426 domain-containing protein [Caulobacteraceae bacterium]|jgi:predicted Zn finger-like uncharacterized protein